MGYKKALSRYRCCLRHIVKAIVEDIEIEAILAGQVTVNLLSCAYIKKKYMCMAIIICVMHY